ncbi:hypothetical protein [Streptomyces mirabilis]|uniref:hypothetical protein n=1 Tax=Streptomyces mirabilis TaxID=68239 RepID=UPI0036B042EF
MAVHHHRALPTAQREGLRTRKNEITVFQPLLAGLAGLDLADTVVTFNAPHPQTTHACFLVEDKKAHCIAVFKDTRRGCITT